MELNLLLSKLTREELILLSSLNLTNPPLKILFEAAKQFFAASTPCDPYCRNLAVQTGRISGYIVIHEGCFAFVYEIFSAWCAAPNP